MSHEWTKLSLCNSRYIVPDVEQNRIILIPLFEYRIGIEIEVSIEFQIIDVRLVLICESQFWHILKAPEFLAKYVLVHFISITEASICLYFCSLHARWAHWLFSIHYKQNKTTKPTNKQTKHNVGRQCLGRFW